MFSPALSKACVEGLIGVGYYNVIITNYNLAHQDVLRIYSSPVSESTGLWLAVPCI